MRNIGKTATLTVVSQLALVAIAVAQVRLLSEILEPDRLGAAFLTLGIVSLIEAIFFSTVVQLGLAVAANGDQNPRPLTLYLELLSNRRLHVAIAMAVIATFAMREYLDSTSNRRAVWLLEFVHVASCVLCMAVLECFRGVQHAILNRKFDHQQLAKNNLRHSVVFTAMVVCSAIFLADGSAILFAAVLTKLALVRLDSNDTAAQRALSADIRSASALSQKLLTTWKPLLVLAAIGWGIGFSDRYIAASTLALKDVGILVATAGIVSRIYGVLSASLTQIFRAQQYRDSQKDSLTIKWIQKSTGEWLSLAAVAGAILWIIIYSISDNIASIVVSSELASDVARLLPLISLSAFIVALTHPLENQYLAFDLGRKLVLLQIISLVLAATFMWFGAAANGLQGIVIARTFAQLTTIGLILIFFHFIVTQKKI